MLQCLARCDPPRRIQICHSANKVTELRVHKIPLLEWLSRIRRVEAPRDSNKAFEEWVRLPDPLQQALKAFFFAKERYLSSKNIPPRVARCQLLIAGAENHVIQHHVNTLDNVSLQMEVQTERLAHIPQFQRRRCLMEYLGLLEPRTQGFSTSGYRTALPSSIFQGEEQPHPPGPISGPS
jgi:hypothetical protein